jgi:hypothetical protein
VTFSEARVDAPAQPLLLTIQKHPTVAAFIIVATNKKNTLLNKMLTTLSYIVQAHVQKQISRDTVKWMLCTIVSFIGRE